MAKRGGFRSDKRKKEVDRLKKQEEKRQRRFNKGRDEDNPDTEVLESEPTDESDEEVEESEDSEQVKDDTTDQKRD